MYDNEESGEWGRKKECVILDSKTLKPIAQNSYLYDLSGNILDKSVREWTDESGWVNVCKYEYQYNKSGNVLSVTFTKWDGVNKTWAAKSDFLVHLYDDNDDFLSIRQIRIDNRVGDGSLISQK